MNNAGRMPLAWGLVLLLLALISLSCGDPQGESESEDGDVTPLVECETNDDCRVGYFCSPRGRCLDACRIDSDCQTGVCNQGFCIACLRDQHCQTENAEGYCDRDYTRCLVGCDDCMSDQDCIEGRCTRVSGGDPDGDDPDGDSDGEDEVIARCGPAPDGLFCEPDCVECVDRNRSRKCASDGKGFSTTYCDDGDFCSSRSGVCEGILCVPGQRSCSEDLLSERECRGDGADWVERACATGHTCLEGTCVNLLCEPAHSTRLFTFNTHSPIAAPDRFCRHSANIGSASWIFLDDERGFAASFLDETARMQLESSAGAFREGATIAAQVYLETGGGASDEVILQKGDPAAYTLSVEDGKATLRMLIGSTEKRLVGAALTRGRWHHLAGTFDGSEIRFYVNGALQGDPVTFEEAKLLASNSQRISVGGKIDSEGQMTQAFLGYVDNLFFSARAIRAEEVAHLNERTSPCQNVTLSEEPDCDVLCWRDIVAMPINQNWHRTDVDLYAGEALFLNPGGCPRPHNTSSCQKPEGLGQSCDGCPVPSAPRYSLLARFGVSSGLMLAGQPKALFTRTAETLYLGYNDQLPEQNQGQLSIIVERGYCAGNACPADMVQIPGRRSCIDRYEASCNSASEFGSTCHTATDDNAHSVAGIVPWTNITPQAAKLACAKTGKRLCSHEEWRQACRGSNSLRYPYGDTHTRLICNDYSLTPPAPYGSLMATGMLVECVNQSGALDLSGNAGEWVELPQGQGFKVMAVKGQSAAQQSSCLDEAIASDEDPLTGFRCCRDLN